MKNSMQRATRVRSNRGGLLAAALTISLAGLVAQPAFADGDDHGGHQGNRHDEHGNDHHRNEHHRYPVYTPEPIYYPRQESPGISLFIPFWGH